VLLYNQGKGQQPKEKENKKMTIILAILTITFATVVATTIAYEVLPMDKTPQWLEDVHYLIWK
jgi:flagellar basal body-associated protein FliL